MATPIIRKTYKLRDKCDWPSSAPDRIKQWPQAIHHELKKGHHDTHEHTAVGKKYTLTIQIAPQGSSVILTDRAYAHPKAQLVMTVKNGLATFHPTEWDIPLALDNYLMWFRRNLCHLGLVSSKDADLD